MAELKILNYLDQPIRFGVIQPDLDRQDQLALVIGLASEASGGDLIMPGNMRTVSDLPKNCGWMVDDRSGFCYSTFRDRKTDTFTVAVKGLICRSQSMTFHRRANQALKFVNRARRPLWVAVDRDATGLVFIQLSFDRPLGPKRSRDIFSLEIYDGPQMHHLKPKETKFVIEKPASLSCRVLTDDESSVTIEISLPN